jgi:hypothetical protein
MTWVFTADDLDGHQVGYQAVWPFDFDLPAPSEGRVEVLRSGNPARMPG